MGKFIIKPQLKALNKNKIQKLLANETLKKNTLLLKILYFKT